MNAAFSDHTPEFIERVKVFDLQMVDGHCIIPYAIYHVTLPSGESHVQAVAFPSTPRAYAVRIDKVIVRKNIRAVGAAWVDLDMKEPTQTSRCLGAAIEHVCRERKDR